MKTLVRPATYCESKYPNFWEFQVCEETTQKQ